MPRFSSLLLERPVVQSAESAELRDQNKRFAIAGLVIA